MALAPDDIIASYFTLAGAGVGQPPRFGFAERIAAASAVGIRAIGMNIGDYEHCRSQGLTDADLRAIADDHGVQVAEIEFLSGWAGAEGERAAAVATMEATLHHLADVFGARHMNVGHGAPKGTDYDVARFASDFAGVCDRAAEHGLLVAFEPMPFFAVWHVGLAWDIVRTAGRPNSGVLVDSYHFYRGNPDPALIAAMPGDRIIAIQLEDIPLEAPCPLLEETTTRRLLPGEGEQDLVGFLRMLRTAGCTAPVGVEMLSNELWALDAATAAHRVATTTRSVIELAA